MTVSPHKHLLDALVIGADGLIGGALMTELSMSQYAAIGTTYHDPPPFDLIPYDLRWPSYLPDARVTYICAGITGFRDCVDNKDAEQVNVVGTIATARKMADRGIKVVFLSSSIAETHLDTAYGRMKLDAERGILDYCGNNACAFRFGPVMTGSRNAHGDGDYDPITLANVTAELIDAMIRWLPGVHRVTSPSKVFRPQIVRGSHGGKEKEIQQR